MPNSRAVLGVGGGGVIGGVSAGAGFDAAPAAGDAATDAAAVGSVATIRALAFTADGEPAAAQTTDAVYTKR